MEITRLPLIDEKDPSASLRELKSYIVRLDRSLGIILENVGADNLEPQLKAQILEHTDQISDSLKNEIIETATQIKELSDKIELSLANEYVAKSDIGTYTEQALQNITLDGKGITQYFEEVSQISQRMDIAEREMQSGDEKAQASILRINAYIRTGKLDDGIYGVEIGNFAGDNTAPYKVRLSENRLSFYVGGDEAAYFSDNSMYISRACVPITLTVGGCTLKNDNGLTFTAQG